MNAPKIFKKPVLALIVIALVIAVIIYFESKKPEIELLSLTEKGYVKAPNFVGIENWINSEPLSIEQLRGEVVLVDFWTYTCINCIRTLPYLKAWDEKYRDKGLVIIGVHTPEFEFEKKYENVARAVNEHGLKYAIAQDNDYATWSSYQNRFWPHKYLIDIDGNIRYDHIGEGAYEETEKMIQKLLKERMERIGQADGIEEISKPRNITSVDFSQIRTPEIYFGYKFYRGNFGNPEGIKPNEEMEYKLPTAIQANQVYLEGVWKNNEDYMELISETGKVVLLYSAKSVNIVAGSDLGSEVNLVLDDSEISETVVREFDLYNVVSAEEYGAHVLFLDVKGKGFRIYTFTFG